MRLMHRHQGQVVNGSYFLMNLIRGSAPWPGTAAGAGQQERSPTDSAGQVRRGEK